MSFVALWKACCYLKTYFLFSKVYGFLKTFTLKRIILVPFLAQLFPSPLLLVLLFFEAVIWWFLEALYSVSLIALLTSAHHRKADFMSSIASCLFSPLLENKTYALLTFVITPSYIMSFPGGSVVKKSTCQCRRCEFSPWSGKISWRKKWQLTPVFLPGEPLGQRSPAGCSL